MNIFKYLVLKVRYEYYKIVTDKAGDRNGRTYYLMPNYNDKLIVMSRNDFRRLRRKHRIDERAKTEDLRKESFYYSHADDKAVSAKFNMYLKYYDRGKNKHN